jgi:hypothetical protein
MEHFMMLQEARFELFIPPVEGSVTDKGVASRTVGFQGESVRVYILIYTDGVEDGEHVNKIKEKESLFSSLKFETQLNLLDSGVSVVESSQGRASVSAVPASLMASESTEYDALYHSVSMAKRASFADSGNGDPESIRLTGTESSNASGYRHSPTRRRRLSFVADDVLEEFEQPDYIYKVVVPMRVQQKYIGETLKLLITVSPSGFHGANSSSSDSFESFDWDQPNRQLEITDHRNFFNSIIERSVHSAMDIPRKQVITNFKVLDPLSVSVSSSSVNLVTYINITAINSHPSLSLTISDLRFLLNTTLALVTVGGKEQATLFPAIESILQVNSSFANDFPLQLDPFEEYCFLLQLEPPSAMFSSPVRGGLEDPVDSRFRNQDNGSLKDPDSVENFRPSDGIVLNTGLFQTQTNIFWRVLTEEKGKEPPANAKDQSFVSTVEVKWSREVHLDSQNMLLMEMEYDNVVAVNHIFTIHIALTNTGGEELNNLVLTVPVDDKSETLYAWESESPSENVVESTAFDVQRRNSKEQLYGAEVAENEPLSGEFRKAGTSLEDIDLQGGSDPERSSRSSFFGSLPSPDGVNSFHGVLKTFSGVSAPADVPCNCILQINADGLRVLMAPSSRTGLGETKYWPFLALKHFKAATMQNEKKGLTLELDDEFLSFFVRDVKPILSRFSTVESILKPMMLQSNSTKLKDEEGAKSASNTTRGEAGQKSPTVVCLEASLPIGHVSPGDTTCATLHFLPLRTGNLLLSSIQVYNPLSKVVYKMKNPTEISVLPESELESVNLNIEEHCSPRTPLKPTGLSPEAVEPVI